MQELSSLSFTPFLYMKLALFKADKVCYNPRDLAEHHIISDVSVAARFARFLLAYSEASLIYCPMESPPSVYAKCCWPLLTSAISVAVCCQ